MTIWGKVKCSLEWGLFLGVITWLLTTTITNEIPALGIWGMIFSRMATGTGLVIRPLVKQKWLNGAVWGGIVNLGMLGLAQVPFGGGYAAFVFGWQRAVPLMIISGIIMGALIEQAVYHREHYLEKVHNEDQQNA